MKNQYVADIGDYGKYSLLRLFIDSGVSVGINWYLTNDDGSSDGKFTKYLDNDYLRGYDPALFDTLRSIARNSDKSVLDVQNSDILPNAKYYTDLLEPEGSPSERKQQRKEWFDKSIEALSGAELLFMDPDNGLLKCEDNARSDANKYILQCEAERYFNIGHDVVYYCHKGRRTQEEWLVYKSRMGNILDHARTIILTFHKGTQRSFIFLIHEDHYFKYRKITEKLLLKFDGIFTEEFSERGTIPKAEDRRDTVVGCSDDWVITIKKEDYEWKKIYNKGVLAYEGFVVNNRAFGMGISYYKNGQPLHEGFWGIKGLLRGKEYYPDGQLHFCGDYKLNNGYGPNYPINGTCFSEDGKMIHQGKITVERSGLGYPFVRDPSGYGHACIKEEFNDFIFMWQDAR